MDSPSSQSSFSVVVTSISAPNGALAEIAARCKERHDAFWVVGDVSSPSSFQLDGCRFLSVQDQIETGFRSAALCPVRHYARKNIGYLAAVRAGARVLVETDDDNFPTAEFWRPRRIAWEAPVVADAGWVNVYRYFSRARIWPRGLPLDAVGEAVPPFHSLRRAHCICPIQQGLADANPDVDAIYRMVLPLPVQFDRIGAMALSPGSWCPFNSQNTTWFSEAFPLLYLPAFCSFRMTDIWRSFVAQRIAWENGWRVLFHDATVQQQRNDHDLMRDFADEVPGYLHNRRIAEVLGRLALRRGRLAIPENLLRCYEALARMDLVRGQEIALVEAWNDDVRELAIPPSPDID
ncbi:MAG: STELLO glycosyltransferase family protein [Bryobacteraceae bacterium]